MRNPQASGDIAVDTRTTQHGYLRAVWTSRAFAQTLVLIGVLLRLRQYLYNRSIWGDESMLARNLAGKSFAELLQPLTHNQGAPPGFLFLTKAAVSLARTVG